MKKFFSMCLCLLMALSMLTALTACSSSIQDDWATIIVGENVPTPQKGKLKSGSNLEDYFSGSIDNVSQEYYNEYVNACIDAGYTIDNTKSGGRYEAFNPEGYEISLSYISGDMHIIIQSPEQLSEITWPTTGIGAKLPATISNLGKITSDSSDCFRVTIGNTTIDEYAAYVESCKQSGFAVDYTKQDDMYEAKNADGYRLNVSYVGCNRIDVLIQSPKEDTTISSEEETTVPSETTPSKDTSSEGVRNEFKEAMDNYEAFFDEYVSFMKKYQQSGGTDLSLLADYANYLTTYAEMMEEFEDWEDEELNDAELAYYIQVQNRINTKLLEVAQ